METLTRLANLSAPMGIESDGDTSPIGICPIGDTGSLPANNPFYAKTRKEPYISPAVLPNGKRIRLLKTLLTSACERNCNYCPFRAGRDFRRETFKPDEMAQTFMTLKRGGVVDGIFLSSGINRGGLTTQDKLLDTAEILRSRYQYDGYLHLKLMPGAEQAQVEHAMRLANRVSVNLEAPNTNRLQKLAPEKVFLEELIQPMRWVQQQRVDLPDHLGWNRRWPSLTTQFVVGAVGESDFELLDTTDYLYRHLGLARAYYMAFNPFIDTPLEQQPPAPHEREHRLYEASFLLRDYGFRMRELPFDAEGNLPIQVDPKQAWASIHLADQPVEINKAEYQQLIRIPGIGPKSAKSIIQQRREQKFQSLADLKHLGINGNRSASFILLDGKRPNQQLSFWH
jgi:predicted DNA-binding helix-hairpin-helix protein